MGSFVPHRLAGGAKRGRFHYIINLPTIIAIQFLDGDHGDGENIVKLYRPIYRVTIFTAKLDCHKFATMHSCTPSTKNLGRLWLAYTEVQVDFTCYNSYLLTLATLQGQNSA